MQYFYLHHRASIDLDSNAKAADVRRSLVELQACWERLQGQIKDKQMRLEMTLEFQQKYQEALMNISGWLDDVELKLFAAQHGQDMEGHLKDTEVG